MLRGRKNLELQLRGRNEGWFLFQRAKEELKTSWIFISGFVFLGFGGFFGGGAGLAAVELGKQQWALKKT